MIPIGLRSSGALPSEEAIIAQRDKCRKRGDMINAGIWQRKLEELREQAEVLQRMPLSQAISDDDIKNEAMEKIVQLIVISDYLCGAAMDVQGWFRKQAGCEVKIIEDIRQVTKQLNHIVHTIDSVGNIGLSEHYFEMVDEIEPQIKAYLDKKIKRQIKKRIKFY